MALNSFNFTFEDLCNLRKCINLRLAIETTRVHRRSDYVKRPVLSATIHPDLKRTLVAMSERTGMSVSQVTDEVLYTGLIEMQELPELDE